MKSLICSTILLCLILLSTSVVAIYTDMRLERFIDELEKISENDLTVSNNVADKIEKEYKSNKTFLILFMYENEIRDIETHISDIKSAEQSNDTDGLIAAKNRLKLHIEQLRRLSTFSIEAIF